MCNLHRCQSGRHSFWNKEEARRCCNPRWTRIVQPVAELKSMGAVALQPFAPGGLFYGWVELRTFVITQPQAK